jgi:hypothetical protein
MPSARSGWRSADGIKTRIGFERSRCRCSGMGGVRERMRGCVSAAACVEVRRRENGGKTHMKDEKNEHRSAGQALATYWLGTGGAASSMVLLSRWRIVAIAVMDGGGGIRRTLTEMGDAGRIETSGGRGIPTGGTAPGLPLGKGGSWQRGWGRPAAGRETGIQDS